jgi:hypothetical protein
VSIFLDFGGLQHDLDFFTRKRVDPLLEVVL